MLHQFVADQSVNVTRITFDLGTEFTAGQIKDATEDLGVAVSFVDTGDWKSTSKIKNFNGVLRRLLLQYVETTSTQWLNSVPTLIEGYNNR